ncbi:hypothetical protein NDU88_007152 [Pleurodeles waltl]|uniref:Uncharacterized protein n=1 Tax=Pleurodeles waltl TaxID=8319 RepID=A0AAV7PNG0_PLEWA|nr:hypothetical protein NDU88_007152 [Pleurodeles waltl]
MVVSIPSESQSPELRLALLRFGGLVNGASETCERVRSCGHQEQCTAEYGCGAAYGVAPLHHNGDERASDTPASQVNGLSTEKRKKKNLICALVLRSKAEERVTRTRLAAEEREARRDRCQEE